MAKKDDDVAKLIRHIRRMIWSDPKPGLSPPRPDAFSILVRGMILIDEALEYVVDAYSAIGWLKLEKNIRQLTLFEKAHLACALGAITEGELECVKAINTLRNRVAHQLDIEVTGAQESELVKVFKSQTKLFQGLNYIQGSYPGTLIFLLLALTFSIRFRTSRQNAKIQHLPDKTNLEHMAAISITTVITEVLSSGVENDDDAIRAILKRQTDEIMKMRDTASTQRETP